MFKKLFLALLLAGPIVGFFQIDFSHSGSENQRHSAHIAPKATSVSAALVQVYQARDHHLRGAVSVRTWIATKDRFARQYTVYEVDSERQKRGKSVVSVQRKMPDQTWYGQQPKLIYELKGREAEIAIPKIDRLARSYPHAHEYEEWLGPNDNTFVSYIIRGVPELRCALPPNAMGKDYIAGDTLFAMSPTKTGFQINYKGMAGIMLSKEEGFEVSIFGLVFGVNPVEAAIKLPGFGTISLKDLPLQ